MRAVTDWRIRREPNAWQDAGRRYHPGRQVIVRTRRYSQILPIGAGGSDDVEVYRENSRLYVVSVNSAHGYAGLEVFPANPADPYAHQIGGETFLQTDYEIREVLGPKGTDLHPRTIARRLAEYL